jgi:hypothetical protein
VYKYFKWWKWRRRAGKASGSRGVDRGAGVSDGCPSHASICIASIVSLACTDVRRPPVHLRSPPHAYAIRPLASSQMASYIEGLRMALF